MNKILFACLIAGVIFTGCKDDEEPPVAPPPNEEELITTLVLNFTPQGGGDFVEWRFTDLDGDGGDDPVITAGILAAGTTYEVTLDLLNETEDPPESITAEIAEEDEEHQFFFEVTDIDLTIAYSDADADGNPIGLFNTVTTGSASTGSVQVTLRHEPNKDASGVSDGDITNAGGETDIEVVFNVEVE